MKIYDIETVGTYSQIHSVVAESYGEAERVFKGKYWPCDIKGIKLHSEYVQIQKWDEQAKDSDAISVQQPHGEICPVCNGFGKTVDGSLRCTACNGTGKLSPC